LKLFNKLPDLITLSDNYLTDDADQNLFPIPNHTTYHKTDITIYINTNIHHNIITDITIPDTATYIIEIKNSANTLATHTFINTYRRPKTHIPTFIDNLQKAIDAITTRNPLTTITLQGDINIDLLKLDSKFYFFLLENNLHTTIIDPTRHDPVHKQTATLIDVTLTTATEHSITAGIISPPLTDHTPTCTIIHSPVINKQHSQKSLSTARYEKNKRQILKQTITAIKHSLTNANANTNTAATTTSSLLHGIQTAIQQTIEQHEKPPKHRINHWHTQQHARRIRRQHQLHRIRIRNPTQANIDRHAKYQKKLKKQIKQDKKDTLVRLLQAARTDTKQQMKILRTVIPRKHTSRTSPTVLHYEGTTYTQPQDIANALVDHYTTIGEKTANSISHNTNNNNNNNGNLVSVSAAKRKKLCANRRRLHEIWLDPKLVYTFEFYQHMIVPMKFQLNLIAKFDLSRYLNAQPFQLMAARASGEYYWCFQVYHERQLERLDFSDGDVEDENVNDEDDGK
jgi:hypothetical protein